MAKSWKFLVTAALVLVAGCFFVFIYHQAPKAPLANGPPLSFSNSDMSQSAERQFLDGDFTIIRDVKSLPSPVLQAFTEQGGSRLTIANPGKNFLATDVIYDSSLPRKRLIFAGVLNDKCFVHYEQGGISLSSVLAFFRLTSKEKMEPLWRGFCGPAVNLQDLRSHVAKGECSALLPSGMR